MLLHVGVDDHRREINGGTVPPEPLHRLGALPLLEDVDHAALHRIGHQVEAVAGVHRPCSLDHRTAGGEVFGSIVGSDPQPSRDNDHRRRILRFGVQNRWRGVHPISRTDPLHSPGSGADGPVWPSPIPRRHRPANAGGPTSDPGFTDSSSSTGNSWSADTLDAPTALDATGGGPTLTSVSHGGQVLTKVRADSVVSSGNTGSLEVWILDEAGIATAGGNTISVVWTQRRAPRSTPTPSSNTSTRLRRPSVTTRTRRWRRRLSAPPTSWPTGRASPPRWCSTQLSAVDQPPGGDGNRSGRRLPATGRSGYRRRPPHRRTAATDRSPTGSPRDVRLG